MSCSFHQFLFPLQTNSIDRGLQTIKVSSFLPCTQSPLAECGGRTVPCSFHQPLSASHTNHHVEPAHLTFNKRGVLGSCYSKQRRSCLSSSNRHAEMAPPTGPRGGGAPKSTPRPARGARGGGIAKRYNTPRTDRDGDVSMDGPANGRNAGKPPTGPSGRGRGGARGGRATRSSTRLAQHIRDHPLESAGRGNGPKSQYNKTTLKILGLKNSKAASNSDGGLRSLLDFLERKSSKEKPITLGRVGFFSRLLYLMPSNTA